MSYMNMNYVSVSGLGRTSEPEPEPVSSFAGGAGGGPPSVLVLGRASSPTSAVDSVSGTGTSITSRNPPFACAGFLSGTLGPVVSVVGAGTDPADTCGVDTLETSEVDESPGPSPRLDLPVFEAIRSIDVDDVAALDALNNELSLTLLLIINALVRLTVLAKGDLRRTDFSFTTVSSIVLDMLMSLRFESS